MTLLKFLSTFLSVIFVTLAKFHFFWAAGGQWGINKALPQNQQGQKVLNPGPLECIVVGMGLAAFGFFYFSKLGSSVYQLPGNIQRIGGKVIPGLFFLRAIGDFKYCGLFKRIKGNDFAKYDSLLFTPLCLMISLLGLLIDVLSKRQAT